MFQSFYNTMIAQGRWMLIPKGLGITLLIAFCAIIIGSVLGCIYSGNGMDLFQLAGCDYRHLCIVVCNDHQPGKSRTNALRDDFEYESLDRI